MNSVGKVNRKDISDALNANERMIRSYDNLQDLVLNDPFINAGDPVTSIAAATKSIPITLSDGTILYLKASITP